jgi:hypothetical protein
MSWNREGQRVVGRYMGTFLVSGKVTESRVKYGGTVQHTVLLDQPLEVYGRSAAVLLLDDTEILNQEPIDTSMF